MSEITLEPRPRSEDDILQAIRLVGKEQVAELEKIGGSPELLKSLSGRSYRLVTPQRWTDRQAEASKVVIGALSSNSNAGYHFGFSFPYAGASTRERNVHLAHALLTGIDTVAARWFDQKLRMHRDTELYDESLFHNGFYFQMANFPGSGVSHLQIVALLFAEQPNVRFILIQRMDKED